MAARIKGEWISFRNWLHSTEIVTFSQKENHKTLPKDHLVMKSTSASLSPSLALFTKLLINPIRFFFFHFRLSDIDSSQADFSTRTISTSSGMKLTPGLLYSRLQDGLFTVRYDLSSSSSVTDWRHQILFPEASGTLYLLYSFQSMALFFPFCIPRWSKTSWTILLSL